MRKAYIDGRTVHLSRDYLFGEEKIDKLVFAEITAREVGEIPMSSNQKMKDYYPLICALTGITPSMFNKLNKEDTLKSVELAAFLLES